METRCACWAIRIVARGCPRRARRSGERGLGDRAVVGREALREAAAPFLLGDRPQRVEAAEAAERPARRREQVAHHVLDAAGEQVRDGRGALEDRAHPVGHGVRVAVGAARGCQLLELVEEQDQPAPVGLRHLLGQLERQVECAVRVGGGESRRERQLHPLPQLADHADHGSRLRGGQRRSPGAARPSQRAVGGGAVGDHRGGERLRELRRVRDAEEVELRRVGAAAPGARQGRLADARLPRAARARHDQVGARLQPRGHLAHVVAPPDQLAGGYGGVRREEVAACLSHLCRVYTTFR